MRIKLSLVALLPIIFAGCGGVSSTPPSAPITYQPSTTSSLSPALRESISYMYDEERLAHDVYLAIYNKQPVYQLYRIASGSEVRHIQAVESLANKYGIKLHRYPPGRYYHSDVQNLYYTLYRKGIRSKKDALEVGCMVEVKDVEDLNRYIAQARAEGAYDVASTYEFLRRGSYNHYWSFDRGLKQLGVSSGCCSLGSKYCHPEYPQNERGGGYGRGGGRGKGYGYGRGRGYGKWRSF